MSPKSSCAFKPIVILLLAIRRHSRIDQTDIQGGGFEWRRSQPRPRPRGSNASKAPLTTSLMERSLTDAYNRTR